MGVIETVEDMNKVIAEFHRKNITTTPERLDRYLGRQIWIGDSQGLHRLPPCWCRLIGVERTLNDHGDVRYSIHGVADDGSTVISGGWMPTNQLAIKRIRLR